MSRVSALYSLLSLLFYFYSVSLAANTPQTSPYYVWWEAEDAVEHNFPASGDFTPKNPKEAAVLSNGGWLNVGGQHDKHFANYKIELEKTDTYHLYARKFWYHGPFRYRFDDEQWTDIYRDDHPILLDAAGLREHVVANWVYLGEHILTKGEHTFNLELLSTRGAAGFDSFVLSDKPFIPMGLRKPDEKFNIKENDSWSFEPGIDDFTRESLWDLRSLNEDIAGMHGYVKLDTSKNHFLLGNDKPVRFWAMNTTIYHSPDMGLIKYQGRHLAKRGFNMVRFHGFIESKTADLFAPDPQQMEYSWRLVAGMKKHGIYTTLSPYWGIHAKAHPDWQGLKGNSNGRLGGLLFFEPNLQRAYKSWLKQWLTTPNPYTGIPLAEDPAVAIFQIQNEDSLLFWTTKNIDGDNLQLLEERYTQWLLKRFGTLENLETRWGNLRAERDSITKTHLTLLPLFELTREKQGKLKQRLDDQYAFLIDVMYSWNTEVERFLREEVGYKGLINAGNWRTANDETMLDGERLSYTANEVLAANHYFNGGKHINPNKRHYAGYRVEAGDLFEGYSALFHPDKLPVNIKQVEGYPMIVSESTWSNPTPYQTEAPFLIAAYSSLNDIDGFYWFSADEAVGFANQFQKFPAASPGLMAAYPAPALLYRKYYLKQAKPSVNEYRSKASIIARKQPLISERSGFDPNRDTFFAHLRKPTSEAEKHRLFLEGPVVSHYGSAENENTHIADREPIEAGIIRSNTGELVWHYKRGVHTIDSPKAQGAVGFLTEQSPLELGHLSIDSQTRYAGVLLVSLDNKPVSESKNLLLQLTTQSRPRSYRTAKKTFNDIYNTRDKKTYEGQIIEDRGTMPFMMKNHNLKITIKSSAINKVTATDSNGYALSAVAFERNDEGIEFTPPAEAIYIVLSTQ